MENLLSDFISKLKSIFGHYDKTNHRFEKASNSEIARELGYSDAQFSRLINGSATEGEYLRANQNVNRIILLEKQRKALKKYNGENTSAQLRRFLSFICFVLLVATCLLTYLYLKKDSKIEPVVRNNKVDRASTLKWAFETSYVTPYVKLDDLPEDCNYPCYKYQGKWALNHAYKIPFFREKNGYHYLAKEVSMYTRCMTEASESGNMFEGYEYQKHEIWYDKRELPLDSFIDGKGIITEAYRNMDFSDNDHFILVAYVHTFFRNEFTIEPNGIKRTGKVIGRDLELVADDQLKRELNKPDKIRKIKNSISRIANNRLKDFSRPIACEISEKPSPDFNEIKDGDLMSYACELTTSRVAISYEKQYVLMDQYIKNTCRSSQK